MEQEFDVEIKEVLSRVQKVKAESLDDAINKAMDMYYAEQIVLGAEDMKGVDFGLSTLFQTNFFRLFFRYCTGV